MTLSSLGVSKTKQEFLGLCVCFALMFQPYPYGPSNSLYYLLCFFIIPRSPYLDIVMASWTKTITYYAFF